jgi:hypothetical protein
MRVCRVVCRWFAPLALCAALMSVPQSGDATVMVKLSPESHVAQSDVIVRVSAISVTTQWNEDRTRPLTLTQLAVREYLKGSGAQVLTLRQFGGTIAGETMVVPGDGHVVQGREYVLFLRRVSGVMYLTAMGQSVYAVNATPNGVMVQRDLTDVEFATPNNHGVMVVEEALNEPADSLSHFSAMVISLSRRGAR